MTCGQMFSQEKEIRDLWAQANTGHIMVQQKDLMERFTYEDDYDNDILF